MGNISLYRKGGNIFFIDSCGHFFLVSLVVRDQKKKEAWQKNLGMDLTNTCKALCSYTIGKEQIGVLKHGFQKASLCINFKKEVNNMIFVATETTGRNLFKPCKMIQGQILRSLRPAFAWNEPQYRH